MKQYHWFHQNWWFGFRILVFVLNVRFWRCFPTPRLSSDAIFQLPYITVNQKNLILSTYKGII